eukprot:236682-Heterocapsa_arctica.AAC.1
MRYLSVRYAYPRADDDEARAISRGRAAAAGADAAALAGAVAWLRYRGLATDAAGCADAVFGSGLATDAA